MKKVLPILAVLLLAGAASAQSISRNGYVTDTAGVIDAASQDQLTQLLADIRQRTGHDMAIVTVQSAPGGIKSLSDSLFRQWNDHFMGVVLVVAVGDHNWWASVSDDLQTTFSTSYRNSLGDRCFKPNFRANNYGAGLLAAVQDFSGRIPVRSGSGRTTTTTTTHSYGFTPSGPSPMTSPLDPVSSICSVCAGLPCIVIFIIFAVVMGILRTASGMFGGWGGGGYWSRPYGYGGWGGGWGGGYGYHRPWGGWGGGSTWYSGGSGGGWSSSTTTSSSSSSSSSGSSSFSGGGGGGSW